MNILFVADPLNTFKIEKDSTFAMMREAAKRGHTINACEVQDIRWAQSTGVVSKVNALQINIHKTSGHDWYATTSTQTLALKDFDAIVMRKDPPFDSEYFYATHLLEQAEREGTKVFNSPRALRDHPEKLALMEFGQFATPTLVSREIAQLKAFHAEHHDVIFKPLDGMGGAGVFRVTDNAMNLGAVLEALTKNEAETIMAQRYLPAIKDGDKRILVINGEPVPYALARIPQGTEVRGNLAAGGVGEARALTARDLEIATTLGPVLAARGLLLVGLDVIGDCLTEVNVTSPTCFQEITNQTGFNVAAMFIDALEEHVNP